MGKVQNFFTPVKHKSRSYLEYCRIDKRIKGNTGCEEWRSVLCVIGVLVQSIICRYSVNNVNKLFVYK